MLSFHWDRFSFSTGESFMKLSGEYEEMVSYVTFSEIVKHHAEEFGLKISDAELQAFSNQARRKLNLLKKEDFFNFLENSGCSLENWESACENELYRMAVKQIMPTDIDYISNAWPIIKSVPGVKSILCDIIISKGKNAGLEIHDEEIQTYSDTFRRTTKLHKADDFRKFIGALGFDDAGWEKNVLSELYSEKLLKMGITPLTKEDLDRNIYISQTINHIVSELVIGHLIKVKTEKSGIVISDEELNTFAEEFRRSLNLHRSDYFRLWLDMNKMSVEDFEVIAEMKLRMSKFMVNEYIDYDKIGKEVRLTYRFLEKAYSIASEMKILEKNNIAFTDDELQNESDLLRRVKGLHNSKTFNDFIQGNNLSADDWENFIVHSLKMKKLRDKICTDERILKYLDQNKVYKKMIKDEIFSEWINLEK
ncbi:MAG: hypothetical protein JXR48_11270 [Candidatus Delongbacteria bacterium]|nr:hypothetical protein [Candidatus Delongbacteria bacterium]MBN2835533.1 hypothetical protein [Candidatus Delongbacteria bacterium]